MLSHHPSGLAVVAAPNRPAEMRTFDPEMVTRLLDLVSTHFDYVVIDMPRTWFSWTDSVLLGSNNLFIVCEATVPGIRHAKQLVAAIDERLGDSPKPTVIVNRFEQQMFVLRPAPVRHRAGAGRVVRHPSPTITASSARRSIAASRSRASRRATRSRSSSRSSIAPPAAAKPASSVAASLTEKLKLSLAR